MIRASSVLKYNTTRYNKAGKTAHAAFSVNGKAGVGIGTIGCYNKLTIPKAWFGWGLQLNQNASLHCFYSHIKHVEGSLCRDAQLVIHAGGNTRGF